MNYEDLKEAASGLHVKGKPLEQLKKKELIETIVSLKAQNDFLKTDIKAERETGIMLLKDFVRNVKPNIN